MYSKGYISLDSPEIDSVHQEFVVHLQRLIDSDNTHFIENFEKVIAHTKEHFANEERLLELHQVSSKREHIDEHTHILAEMDYFLEKAKNKKLVFAKAYAKERLPQWLYQHTISMDADLARVLNI